MDKQTDRTEEKVSNIFYHPNGWFHRLVINEAVLSLLLALSFIGVAYTDIAGGHSINFWLWMIPVFAIAAIMLEWSRYIQGEIDGLHFIRQQVLHWIAVFLAIKLTFILLQIGRLPNNATAFVLMMITSAGIYGFLTSAYQKTSDQLGMLEKKIELVEAKKDRYQTQYDEYSAEKNQLQETIIELSKGLSNNVIQYKDKETGKIITPDGGITLLDDKGQNAATWLYADMMKHWNRKHAQAAYIPSMCQKEPENRKYIYGSQIDLGTGTDFLKFLESVAKLVGVLSF